MKLRNSFFLLLTLVSITFFTSCEEDGNILYGSVSGIVTNLEDNEPIQGITVTLIPGSASAVTGNDGIYHFPKVAAGQYTLQFKTIGYQTNTKLITVEPDKSVTGDIQLSPGSGNLGVDRSSLEFGTSDNFRILNLKNTGKSSMDWEIKYNCKWIKSITPSSGTIKPGVGNVPVTVEIDRKQLGNTDVQKTNFTISTSDSGGMDIQVSVNGSSGGESPALTIGLMAFYNFDNDNAHDVMGTIANGILVNNPKFITDTPNGEGKALSISAMEDQHLSISHNPLATSSGRSSISYLSICFWIKDFGPGQIFSASDSYAPFSQPYFHFKDNAFHIEISTSQGGYSGDNISFEKGASKFQDGKWHHVAYVMEKELHTLYIDGQHYGSKNLSGTDYQFVGVNPIHFGGNCGFSSRTANSMKVDNIRFYNRALTVTDVKVIREHEKQ